MNVGWASADWALAHLDRFDEPTMGGSGHYRIGSPARRIGGPLGHLVWAQSQGRFGVKTWDDESHFDCDVLVMQRFMHEGIGAKMLGAALTGQTVVNDVDDLFWDLHPANRAHAATDPRKNPGENREHYVETLKASHLVTCSTPYLAERLAQHGVTAVVIENGVDTSRWWQRSPHRVTDQPTVGWVGATDWRSGDLETLRGVIGPWLAQTGCRWHHSGWTSTSKQAHDLARIDRGRVDCSWLPMVSIENYPLLFGPLDVGLVPLNDVPFNRAKSWIKGLEYAAAGVPFIAQALPEYERLHHEYGVGRLARKPADWRAHLDELRDPTTRLIDRERNAAGIESLTLDRQADQWRAALAAITGAAAVTP